MVGRNGHSLNDTDVQTDGYRSDRETSDDECSEDIAVSTQNRFDPLCDWGKSNSQWNTDDER